MGETASAGGLTARSEGQVGRRGEAQWPQFEQSPIQIGGGGGTGEENLAGGKVEADRNRFSSKQPIEIE